MDDNRFLEDLDLEQLHTLRSNLLGLERERLDLERQLRQARRVLITIAAVTLGLLLSCAWFTVAIKFAAVVRSGAGLGTLLCGAASHGPQRHYHALLCVVCAKSLNKHIGRCMNDFTAHG
jgi:hypothetical protein